MQVNARIYLYSVIAIGIGFMLLGFALNEQDLIKAVDLTRQTNLKAWKEFLQTWLINMAPPK